MNEKIKHKLTLIPTRGIVRDDCFGPQEEIPIVPRQPTFSLEVEKIDDKLTSAPVVACVRAINGGQSCGRSEGFACKHLYVTNIPKDLRDALMTGTIEL